MSKPYSSVYNTHKKNLTENIQMADTYTQLYIHIVFSVKGRQPLIPKQHKAELHKYITGIVTNKMQKMIQINSMPDHTHIFIGITPDIAISDLVRDIKRNATQFINRKRWTVGKFMWQEGFAAFSYSHSQLKEVIAYIENQEQHHSHKTFKEEYLELLSVLMSCIIRYMFLMRTMQTKGDAHGAPLERRVCVDRHSIDIPPRWGGRFWLL